MITINTAIDQDIGGHLFERVYVRGMWMRFWAALRRRPSRLLNLNELAAGWNIRSRHFAGSRSVPIKQIRGSENRVGDFDSGFHPLDEGDKDRWRRVAQAWLSRHDLPPVELIRVGEIYFVRDGHHRISVAAALGEQEIDAVVTEWEVDDVQTVSRQETAQEPLCSAIASSCATDPLGA